MELVSTNVGYFESSFHGKEGDIFVVREKEDTWLVLMKFDLSLLFLFPFLLNCNGSINLEKCSNFHGFQF